MDLLFSTIVSLFIDSGIYTFYMIACALILCVLFQIFVLRKDAIKNDVKLSVSHFVGVYIFLIYIGFVYNLTGMGTIWDILFYGDIKHTAEISLIPFDSFETEFASYNFLTYLFNTFMMMPFGFMLALLWRNFRSLKKIAIAGAVFSLAIEISQLFNHRATTLDDIIMNTLGAIVGYLIFLGFYKLKTRKRDSYMGQKESTEYPSKILRNEAIICLICSFMGVFLFYNALLGVDWNDNQEGVDGNVNQESQDYKASDERGSNIEDSSNNISDSENTSDNENTSDSELNEIEYEFITGNVTEVHDDSVIINRAIIYAAPGGGEMMIHTDEKVNVTINTNTVLEISRTNRSGSTPPVIVDATKNDLEMEDTINVYLLDGSESIAEKIVIWRFDG